jgi:hypothetical protein
MQGKRRCRAQGAVIALMQINAALRNLVYVIDQIR